MSSLDALAPILRCLAAARRRYLALENCSYNNERGSKTIFFESSNAKWEFASPLPTAQMWPCVLRKIPPYLKIALLLQNMQIWRLVTIWQADTTHDSLALADQLWFRKKERVVIPFLRFVSHFFKPLLALQYKSSYVFALPSTSSILIVNLKSCMTKNDDQRQYAFIFSVLYNSWWGGSG